MPIFPSILYVINCIYNYIIFLIMAGHSLTFTPSAIFEPLYGDKLSLYYYPIFNEYYNLFTYLFTITNRKKPPTFATSNWPQPPRPAPARPRPRARPSFRGCHGPAVPTVGVISAKSPFQLGGKSTMLNRA